MEVPIEVGHASAPVRQSAAGCSGLWCGASVYWA